MTTSGTPSRAGRIRASAFRSGRRGWERRLAPLSPFDGSNRRRGAGRLSIASNRLPVTLEPDWDGEWSMSSASGGLVTALDPVLRRRRGIWTGWAGTPDAGQEELSRALGRKPGRPPYSLQAVPLSAQEEDLFYRGFANEVLWPLFHGFPDRWNPEPRYWEAYRTVNRRFARSLASTAGWDDLIWVHDYHLMLAGKELRALGSKHRLAFFLHIPFPPFQLLERMPWAGELVEGLCHFDLLGFQTSGSRDNFLDAARHIVPDAFSHGSVDGHPFFRGREIRTGAFPISIDATEFSAAAHGPVVVAMEREIRKSLGGRTLMLGVDRLDYSKGIPEKLRGFDLALDKYPELRGSVLLKQLVVPSRDQIPAYRETKREIERLARSINERWGTDAWQPVEYLYDSWGRSDLLAHYRSADVALVTPLNDGMNLVAKEYAVANQGSGVIILSAFAGAAAELGSSALLVDPCEPDSVATTLLCAFRMPLLERKERMARAEATVRTHDVHGWVEDVLAEGMRAG